MASPSPPASPPPPPAPTQREARAVSAVEATQESAVRAVHAAEELVERAVVAAERSVALRVGQRGLRVLLLGLRAIRGLAIIAYFLFGITVLVTRYYLLPHIDDWRTRIEAVASAALKAPVGVGRIEADWQGLHPRLLLRDVTLQDPAGGNVLTLPEVEVVVSWTTLIAWQPRVQSLTVQAPELEVRRLPDRRWKVAGIVIDPQAPATDSSLADWVLAQRHISIRDARVHFVDELGVFSADPPVPVAAGTAQTPPERAAAAPVPPTEMEFTDVNLVLTHGLTTHHMALQLRPPPQLSGPVDVRAEFTQDWDQPTTHFSSWSGRLYAQLDAADLARLDALAHLVPAPARLDRATGALRAWIDFSGLDATRTRADVALNDVSAQLRPDLQPLRLQLLEGRVTLASWSDRDGDSREVAITGLRMEGPDQPPLAATDLLFRTTQASGGGATTRHFEASRIVLADWGRLALKVPLPADSMALIQRTAARGTLEDLQASWGGASGAAYALRARFSGLGFALGASPATSTDAPATDPSGATDAPTPAAPYAVENLAGNVDLNQDSGTLHLDSTHGRLHLPTLFEEPSFPFDVLAARVRWTREGDAHVAVNVDSFSLANDDLEVNGSGAYEKAGTAPARLDLSGRLARGRVNAVHRYLPQAMAASARSWIRGALLDGGISDGSFYLHGDPLHFPFGDARYGEFHAALHLQDGLLDFAPRPSDAAAPPTGTRSPLWPALSGIDADLVFERNHLTINGRSARAYGYELNGVSARLPDLDRPDQHLYVDGQGAGLLAELLRYLVASPVNRWTGGALASADAGGTARLKIKLDIPLAHAADTVVNGAVTFRNNNLVLRPDIAPFSGVTGELGFNERGISLNGIGAGYIGGDVRINGDTQADGTIALHASGSATPQGAKRQVEPAVLRRVLDHTRGSFRYSAALAIHHGSLGLQVDSDLIGLAADLPEPFRKAAAEARALHVETVPVAGSEPAREILRASYAGQLTVELQRTAVAGDGMHIERGAIAIGARANVPDKGLLLLVDQPQLDVDRWQRVLGLNGASLAPAAGDTAGGRPAAPATGDAEGVDLVVVHTAALSVSGKTLNNVSLSARRDPDLSWVADIDSDQASGSVRWMGTHGAVPGHVTARLAKLVIPDSDKKQVTDLLDAPPTDFPALDIVADQLELGSTKLGRLEVDAQNGPAAGSTGGRSDSWNLQRLTLANPDGKLTASGTWQRDGSTPARRMAVKFVLDFSNGGGVLGRFGIPDAIRNGKGRFDGDVSWRGSPFAINYPSLSGKVHLLAEKGQFLKADAGVRGRLVSVFSLQSLGHRLTGDFRDVFSEGFAFDSLTASADIKNGTLATDDFIMKGVNAVVRIKGETDLNAETQNLEVVYIPAINVDSASLAYALVNPAIGLATFVANHLFRKPLEAAFTNVYEVTGSWADPKVEPVKFETRTAAAAGDKPADKPAQ